MRISTTQMQKNALTAMLDQQVALSKTQQQVASGQRILSPSDDVLGTTQVLALQKVIATYKQYDENSFVADSRIKLEEGALTGVVDGLQRARELAIQGTNTTYGATERRSIAAEVRQILGEVRGIANTVDSNGEYIFAGFNVDTAPFAETENPVGSGLYDYSYTGDLGQRTVQIGATRFIAVGDPGDSVFMNVPESGGGTQNLFESLEQLAVDLESNVSPTTSVDDLRLAIEHLAGFISQSGARQNAIESHRILNTDVIFQSEKTMSEIKDMDYAEGISRLNTQLAGLQAAQQTFAQIQNLSLFNFL